MCCAKDGGPNAKTHLRPSDVWKSRARPKHDRTAPHKALESERHAQRGRQAWRLQTNTHAASKRQTSQNTVASIPKSGRGSGPPGQAKRAELRVSRQRAKARCRPATMLSTTPRWRAMRLDASRSQRTRGRGEPEGPVRAPVAPGSTEERVASNLSAQDGHRLRSASVWPRCSRRARTRWALPKPRRNRPAASCRPSAPRAPEGNRGEHRHARARAHGRETPEHRNARLGACERRVTSPDMRASTRRKRAALTLSGRARRHSPSPRERGPTTQQMRACFATEKHVSPDGTAMPGFCFCDSPELVGGQSQATAIWPAEGTQKTKPGASPRLPTSDAAKRKLPNE